MAPAASERKPLSSYFTDPMVRRAFERGERDLPPAALTVAIEPVAPLASGLSVQPVFELA